MTRATVAVTNTQVETGLPISAQRHWNDLRILMIGGGAVVHQCHLPALNTLGMSGNALVVDASNRNLEMLRKVSPHIALRHQDFRRVLSDKSFCEQFDIAIIALPNNLHEPAVEQALLAGLHVLCEKPLTLTKEGCCRLQRIADSAARTLGVGMVRRLLPSV